MSKEELALHCNNNGVSAFCFLCVDHQQVGIQTFCPEHVAIASVSSMISCAVHSHSVHSEDPKLSKIHNIKQVA